MKMLTVLLMMVAYSQFASAQDSDVFHPEHNAILNCVGGDETDGFGAGGGIVCATTPDEKSCRDPFLGKFYGHACEPKVVKFENKNILWKSSPVVDPFHPEFVAIKCQKPANKKDNGVKYGTGSNIKCKAKRIESKSGNPLQNNW